MWRYAATIFLSAFLLFQVQPLAAKAILPWFGGSPSVWSTCMLFFQVLLLGGYLYAHLLSSRLDGRTQALTHTTLLVVAMATLPILPGTGWKPTGDENPTLRILVLLAANIGLPYFLLSSTGPLVQRWFSWAAEGKSPYRLYALSNIGSVAALLTFPFVFEPVLSGVQLDWIWSTGFCVFALLCVTSAWSTIRHAPQAKETPVRPAAPAEPVPGRRLATWLGLAALPSMMLLAVTNVMCQDIAVVPFLWVAPLTVYLLTFILCFDSDRWYKRRFFAPALGIVAPLALITTYLVERNAGVFATGAGLISQIAIHTAMLFLCGMVCHGELAAARPGPSRLTLFYVCLSAGGALGGVFVALVAPMIFTGYVELWIGAAASTVVAGAALWRVGGQRMRWVVAPVLTATLAGAVTLHVMMVETDVVDKTRGFFGRLRVQEQVIYPEAFTRNMRELKVRCLTHGHIIHGLQIMNDRLRRRPICYFAEDSGVGVAMRFLREVVAPRRAKENGPPVSIGVIGLGAGTLAAYPEKGETIVYYEIQPEVVAAAEKWFTYLEDARRRGVRVETVLGDARIRLERELENGGRRFDLLVCDAFSGDGIPKHLLTKECSDLYWKHLKQDGILAFHITNRYLDLLPVVRGLAEHAGKQTVVLVGKDDDLGLVISGLWVLVTDNQTLLDAEGVRRRAIVPRKQAAPLLWTDDFSSLWHVLKR